MEPRSRYFRLNAARALSDATLQDALGRARSGFVDKRARAIAGLPEFEALRAHGESTREHTLANLDYYLETFESRVRDSGGEVHWASTPAQACAAVVDICRRAGARTVAKGKSMAGEEIGVNEALHAAGIEPVETDLGEYILQLAQEPPSHIIAPAVHKTREQVAHLFRAHHGQKHGGAKSPPDIRALVDEARAVLRRRFLEADVGITGANFLIAETGSSIIVTNEGNGDLSSCLPRVHIVTAGIEKVIPGLEDAGVLLRLLARSATGQDMTAYTTLHTGPRRAGDLDGPAEYHVVLIDNGRSAMLANEFRPMLRCIRCGACLNHCPVYGAVGGHAYGWVYPGPMGAILTPALIGLEEAGDLPNACTLNGRCETVCPVRIPLPRLLRAMRERQFRQQLTGPITRVGLWLWSFLARRPALYHFVAGVLARVLGAAGSRRGRFRRLPLAGGWTAGRDFPAPQGRTFQAAWRDLRGRS